MKQYLLNTSYLNNKQGPEGIIIRMVFKPIKEDEVLEAMENDFYGFNTGIVDEEYGQDLINHFGLSYAHGESFQLGCSVFKQ